MKAKVIITAALLMACSMANAQTKEDAVLFSGVNLDNSYLLAEKISVEFDKDGNASICLNGKTQTEFELDGTNTLTAEFKDAFKLTANQDPDTPSNYYSTFFTSDGAYKVPETAKAYIGKVETGEETDVLKLADVGSIIHQGEAVILKATGSDITLMPSCNEVAASTKNALQGIDEPKTLGANDYALSLGQYGVGFYLWNGQELGAHKAYLTWEGSKTSAKAFSFKFDNGGTTSIRSVNVNENEDENLYNLNGMRVGKNYKGIVIKNGKKIYNK